MKFKIDNINILQFGRINYKLKHVTLEITLSNYLIKFKTDVTRNSIIIFVSDFFFQHA